MKRVLVPCSRGNEVTDGTRNIYLQFSVLTHNVLAQCLVRRALFPYCASNVLKEKFRTQRLLSDILRLRPNVAVLQEVDGFASRWAPRLQQAGYDWVYALKDASAPKGHGLCVAWQRAVFSREMYFTAAFDGLVEPTSVSPATGNIFQLVALRFLAPRGDPVPVDLNLDLAGSSSEDSSSRTDEDVNRFALLDSPASELPADQILDEEPYGIVITNSHLFWNPSGHYERLRQTYVLLHEAVEFQKALVTSLGTTLDHWPLMVAGDFNTTPSDPVYSALCKLPLSPDLRAQCEPQALVPRTGFSPPPLVSTSAPPIINPLPASKLLSLFTSLPRLVSAYSTYTQNDPSHEINPNWFSGTLATGPIPCVVTIAEAMADKNLRKKLLWIGEPSWTVYTGWKGCLDYIFAAAPTTDSQTSGIRISFEKVLSIPLLKDVFPALPNDNISSDHVSLMAVCRVWKYGHQT